MFASETPDWFAGRPAGVSSRLRRGDGPVKLWVSPSGVTVELPVLLDLVEMDPSGQQAAWWVVAHIDLQDDRPVVTRLVVGADHGLDLVRLQRDFRWYTPEDVVTRIVPRLIAHGHDPFSWEYPVTGYPDAASSARTQGRRLSDEFLEDIAREYLEIGRGYAKELAARHQVSTSTVVSWVHKARLRGIVSATARGVKGGEWVDRGDRSAR